MPAAVVDFSALQAGGFHPFLRDVHQCTMTPFHMYAYGGVKIDLPADEIDEAVAYIRNLRSEPITDFDPIEEKPAKDLGLTFLAAIGFFPGFLILLLSMILMQL